MNYKVGKMESGYKEEYDIVNWWTGQKTFAVAVWGMIIFAEKKENSVAATKDTKTVTDLKESISVVSMHTQDHILKLLENEYLQVLEISNTKLCL